MPVESPVELIKVDDTQAAEEQHLLLQRHIPETARRVGSLALLFTHGWLRPPNDRAARFVAEHGFETLVVNFRGHNGSDGDARRFSRADALVDARTAYDYFESLQPPGTRIGMVTHSFSAYEGILLTRERAIACISMRAPANYPDEGFNLPQMGRGHVDPAVMRFRHQKLSPSENMALAATRDYRGEIQIVESGRDTYIPHQTTQNYVDAAPDVSKVDYHLMPEWGHLLEGDPAKLREFEEDILLPWLQRIA